MAARRLLYVGSDSIGTTSEQRARALQKIGFDVKIVPENQYSIIFDIARKISYHSYVKLGLPIRFPDASNLNERVIETALEWKPEILWLDRALTLRRDTFQRIRQNRSCVIIGFSVDDLGGRHNRSPNMDETFEFYDVFITTKSYNVLELKALGVQHPIFMSNGVDDDFLSVCNSGSVFRQQFGAPVGFIGTYEAERARSLSYLAIKGVEVRVWGGRWDRWRNRPHEIKVEFKDIYGIQYAKTINCTDINLCFLRKLNRDLQTTRSVEIPGSGGFMLAERTEEHLALFEEGKEAEFFGCDDELFDKCKYYLERPQVRREIAEAGRARCLSSGYSYSARLGYALRMIECLP